MGVKKVGFNDMNWTEMVPNWVQCRASVLFAVNFITDVYVLFTFDLYDYMKLHYFRVQNA